MGHLVDVRAPASNGGSVCIWGGGAVSGGAVTEESEPEGSLQPLRKQP